MQLWANVQTLNLTIKKEKSDRREREKGLREKRVQRGKTTGKRREVFLFGIDKVTAEVIVYVTIKEGYINKCCCP